MRFLAYTSWWYILILALLANFLNDDKSIACADDDISISLVSTPFISALKKRE